MSASGGGAATGGGMNFQYYISAYFAVRVLAEIEASPVLGWPAATTLTSVSGETNQAVDDLLIINSRGDLGFGQAKRTLSLSDLATSAFGSAIDQFTRQVLINRNIAMGPRAWERPLDPGRDRLVLFIGPASSGPVKKELPTVLGRVRGLLTGQALQDATNSQSEKDALASIVAQVKRTWTTIKGGAPSDPEIIEVLRLIHVMEIDVEPGGRDERHAKDLLRSSVLEDPAQADTAWSCLIRELGTVVATKGTHLDRRSLARLTMSVRLSSRATWRASSVLPVPGGP